MYKKKHPHPLRDKDKSGLCEFLNVLVDEEATFDNQTLICKESN